MMTLADTIPMMTSDDYRERFFAEYAQTKIRYEKLKDLLNQIEASMWSNKVKEVAFNCPMSVLREQQKSMGEYLHNLEVRAIIEHIDLSMVEV